MFRWLELLRYRWFSFVESQDPATQFILFLFSIVFFLRAGLFFLTQWNLWMNDPEDEDN